MPQFSRRTFLTSAAAMGGGLVLGFGLATEAVSGAAQPAAAEIAAWIVIRPDETVVIRVARSEMGQGISTALPMLVAEELECDWSKVTPEFVAPEENRRRDRIWRDMTTAASRSVSASHDYLLQAGATAREMLIAAAAERWQAPAAECRAAGGVIRHLPTGRRVTYGAIAKHAANVTPPADVKLKDPKDWKLIGSRQRAFGVEAKITGEPIYGIDVQLSGLWHAAIRQCPIFGGRLRAVDEAKIRGRKGVCQVVRLPDAVAVVAESWWQAKTALDVLTVTWDAAGNGGLSTAGIAESLRRGLDTPDADVGRDDGDAAQALARGVRRIEAVYSVPFLAHATMEPQNCTAHVTRDKVEIWVPTQDGEASLSAAATAAGVPESCVVVHRTMLGGGFGRRSVTQDFVAQAVRIAKETGRPVKLLWTREEDIRHDFYRPAAMAKQAAALDATGMPVAWDLRVAAPSVVNSLAPGVMFGGFDRHAMQGLLEDMPYAIPNYRAEYAMCEAPVPLGMWRAVNHSQNAFFKESFVDEMAHAAGQDPYLFRRKLLGAEPRQLAVLDAAADRAGWAAPTLPGVSRGIAVHGSCDSFCAQVVEVSVDVSGRLCVHRVVSAIDCGYVVNPAGVEAQTEGAIAYGLTAALYGEITIKDGGAEQSNFHDYEIVRIAEMPKVETVLVPSGGFWGGVGEPPLAPLAPALCNAIFAATGKRIRSLPIKAHDLRAA